MPFTVRRLSGEKARRKFPWRKWGVRVLTIGYPLLKLFRLHRKHHLEEKKAKKRLSILKKLLLILLALLLSLLVLAGMAKALIAWHIITVKSIISAVGTELPTDANGFTNFLVLGVGDASHEGVDLTDTMMIISMDPKNTKSVVMISIPRDLHMIKTNNMGSGKINELYRNYKVALIRKGESKPQASMDAMKELAKELGNKFGLQIHEVVKVDFIGFVQAVDALGGVDIDVPEAIVDPEYPGPNYTYETFSIAAGPQHLDGETALKYARSRHSTSDFGRSARQQELIAALTQRAKEKGVLTSPSTLINLYRAVADHVEMTLSLQDLLGAAKIGQQIDRTRIISVQLNNTNGFGNLTTEPGGFLYVPPRADFHGSFVLLPVPFVGQQTWQPIRTFTDLLLHHRDLYIQNPTIDILNAGAKSGLGHMLGSELIRNDLTPGKIQNAKIPDLDQSMIVARTESGKLLLPFLSQATGIPMADTLPVGLSTDGLGEITILIGKDYTFAPFSKILGTGVSSADTQNESGTTDIGAETGTGTNDLEAGSGELTTGSGVMMTGSEL